MDSRTVQVPVAQIAMGGQILTGHLAGDARDAEWAMRFAAATGGRPPVEHMPLAQRNATVQRLRGHAARFRIVDPVGRP